MWDESDGETELLSNVSYEPVFDDNYQAANGWVAYTEFNSGDEVDSPDHREKPSFCSTLWLRTPDGQSIAVYETDKSLRLGLLAPIGQVAFQEGTDVLLGGVFGPGNVAMVDRVTNYVADEFLFQPRFHNNAFYANGQWMIAYEGQLFSVQTSFVPEPSATVLLSIAILVTTTCPRRNRARRIRSCW